MTKLSRPGRKATLDSMELRSHKGTVELREGPNGPMITGYMAVFDKRSADMGFIETIDPAAFNKTLQEADVRGIGNHNTDWLLGRTKPGTMRVRNDGNGVYYEIDVNMSDPDGQRAYQKVQRGDWDGSSFTFQTIRDEWNWDTSPPERRLLEVSLIEGGPCTFPAYPDATATARALAPIAEKVGKPVEDLVTAMRSGDIRSLINGGTTMSSQESVAVEERTDEPEKRVGKMISAANLETLHSVHESLSAAASGLRDLIDVAQTESPAGSEVADAADVNDKDEDSQANGERGLSFTAAEVELRTRLAALEAA